MPGTYTRCLFLPLFEKHRDLALITFDKLPYGDAFPDYADSPRENFFKAVSSALLVNWFSSPPGPTRPTPCSFACASNRLMRPF